MTSTSPHQAIKALYEQFPGYEFEVISPITIEERDRIRRIAESWYDIMTHAAAHITHGWDTVTDQCPTQNVVRSLGESQTAFAITLIDYIARAHPTMTEDLYVYVTDDEETGPNLDVLKHAMRNDGDSAALVMDWVEENEDELGLSLAFEPGENGGAQVATKMTCEYLASDDPQMTFDHSILDIKTYTNENDADDKHVEVVLSCGGPSVVLRRDFETDRLVATWSSASATQYGEAITTVMDYVNYPAVNGRACYITHLAGC